MTCTRADGQAARGNLSMRTLVDRVVEGGETPARLAAPFVLMDSFPAPPAARGVVLAVLGLTADGARRFLAVEAAGGDEEEAWRAFLTRLTAVMADRPLLVCSPGQVGVRRALRRIYPQTPVQVSVPHRLLAWARQVEGAQRVPWLAEVRRIFTAPDLETAVARFRTWRTGWRHRDHRVVEALEEDLAAHLAFYRFPRRLWKKVRTATAVRKTYLQDLRAGILGRPTLEGAGAAAAGPGALVFYRTVRSPAPDGLSVPDPSWRGAPAADAPDPDRSPVGATA